MNTTNSKLGRPRAPERGLAVALVRGGATLTAAAGQTGLSASTVCVACKDAGVRLPKRSWKRATDPKWQKVDWSQRDVDIARMLNLSHTRVYQMRRYFGK
jgi:hypothetical protein